MKVDGKNLRLIYLSICLYLIGCSSRKQFPDNTLELVSKRPLEITIVETSLISKTKYPHWMKEEDVLSTQASSIDRSKSTELELKYQLLDQPFTTVVSRKGETLMQLSFRIYGDYRLWQNIIKWNKDIIPENRELPPDTILNVKRPLEEYKRPSGHPYFIKRGDSLSKISRKVYGNWKLWPLLEKHNPHQIRDPDLIFAGFTLFYKPYKKLKMSKLSQISH